VPYDATDGPVAVTVPVAVPLVNRVAAGQRVRLFAARHWLFGGVLALAVVLRVIVLLGYEPVEWFNDSYSYVTAAVKLVPETIRPSGYALLLAALRPMHSFAVVARAQHLLGLATGILVYGILRARGLRAWIATLAAVPVLFDAYELQLEHLVMADTLFMVLITAAVVLLCLRNQPGWVAAAAAGLLFGASAVVRTDGRPLLVVAAVCLIVRRAGWRPVTALVVAGMAPLAAYMGWYHQTRGPYALTEGDVAFLYSRVMAFADCAKMHPPAPLRPLCDSRPPSRRPVSADYVWQQNRVRRGEASLWAPGPSKLASEFAFLAIRKQPVDYLWVTVKDIGRTFAWTRSTAFPDPATAGQYQFAGKATALPRWAPLADLHSYQPGRLTTTVVRPYASFLAGYQRYLYFRGTLLALTLLIGAAWVVTGRRRGAPGLLPWCAAVTLIATPPATAGFSYRYVLAAVPCACIAAGLAGVAARIRPGVPA
jgi:Dolichyl-phosphate-mannose-protein mannosyltransferase